MGDILGNPGNSAVAFLDGTSGPQFYDNDGSVKADFIAVAALRTGRTEADIVREFRKTGTISGVQVCAPAEGSQPSAVPEIPPNQAMPQHLVMGGQGSTLSLEDLDRTKCWAPADSREKKCIGDWRHSGDASRGGPHLSLRRPVHGGLVWATAHPPAMDDPG